ncbi:hypothetical protein BDY19DRAFT_1058481 [Irpex rosettiformis]|uniref:Uncharacterized protein n=1 Tax=Irpex rosettiformis TaxID=378272 RepID=A0ACB8TY69_9APHY|nr:hypothetical protein BDY19DRAFT_1058481 [Irpex rosettiformis]
MSIVRSPNARLTCHAMDIPSPRNSDPYPTYHLQEHTNAGKSLQKSGTGSSVPVNMDSDGADPIVNAVATEYQDSSQPMFQETITKYMKALTEQPGIVNHYMNKLREHGIDPEKHEAWFPIVATGSSPSNQRVQCRVCGPQAIFRLKKWPSHLCDKKHVSRVSARTQISSEILLVGFQKFDRRATVTSEGTEDVRCNKGCARNSKYDEEIPTTDPPPPSTEKIMSPAELEWARERERLNKWKAAKAARAVKAASAAATTSSMTASPSTDNNSGVIILAKDSDTPPPTRPVRQVSETLHDPGVLLRSASNILPPPTGTSQHPATSLPRAPISAVSAYHRAVYGLTDLDTGYGLSWGHPSYQLQIPLCFQPLLMSQGPSCQPHPEVPLCFQTTSSFNGHFYYMNATVTETSHGNTDYTTRGPQH